MGNINGYKYFYDPKHPIANKSGIVYEHRDIIYQQLGRQLLSKEHIHHKDGNRNNNNLENLKIVTNSDHAKEHHPDRKIEMFCAFCNKSFKCTVSKIKYRVYCSIQCKQKASRKVARPSKKVLAKEIRTLSWLALGRKYGVSDNSIRKWAKRYNLI